MPKAQISQRESDRSNGYSTAQASSSFGQSSSHHASPAPRLRKKRPQSPEAEERPRKRKSRSEVRQARFRQLQAKSTGFYMWASTHQEVGDHPKPGRGYMPRRIPLRNGRVSTLALLKSQPPSNSSSASHLMRHGPSRQLMSGNDDRSRLRFQCGNKASGAPNFIIQSGPRNAIIASNVIWGSVDILPGPPPEPEPTEEAETPQGREKVRAPPKMTPADGSDEGSESESEQEEPPPPCAWRVPRSEEETEEQDSESAEVLEGPEESEDSEDSEDSKTIKPKIPPPTWEVDTYGIDPRSENRVGSILYRQRVSSWDQEGNLREPDELFGVEGGWGTLGAHVLENARCIGGNPDSRYSHYLSVLDACFVPGTRHSETGLMEFITVGADRTVRHWVPPSPDDDDWDTPSGNRWDLRRSGEPKAHRIWEATEFNTLRNYNRHPPIEAFPSRVHFIPDASSQLFAVPCGGSGAIHIHSLAYEKSLDIVYPSPEIFKESNTGRFDAYACWGMRASKGWMFAGTDPPKDGMGSVVCWDVGARAERFVDTPRDDKDGGASQWDGRGIQHFELENGATQCLGVDYWGERVAIVSYDTTPFRGAGDPGLSLRIYDIRAPRSLPSSPTISLNLNTLLSSPSLLSGERAGASSVLFSPCTTYIAVARENNITQVFDARFVGLGDLQRVLMECRHETEHEGPEITVQGKAYSRYGIAAMDWMDASIGPRRAPGVLVTGGDDGAVRSWDLRRSPDDLSQGRNLLSMDPQQRLVGIAAFSLGDVYAGERALIVGDMNGTIQEYLDWGDV